MSDKQGLSFSNEDRKQSASINRKKPKLKLIKDGSLEGFTISNIKEVLGEKNLAGMYSDEIFKEQSTMIEDKIIKAQVTKDDTAIDKYNIDKVTSFVKTLLADLGETYRRSNVEQLKVLLSSMFLGQIAWNYEGTLDCMISPLYQYIQDFSGDTAPSGAGFGSELEPLIQLFDIKSSEIHLLFVQLSQLKTHLKINSFICL